MLKKLLFPVMVKGIPLNNKTTRQQNNQTTKQPTTYLYIFLFIDISFLNLTPNILFIGCPVRCSGKQKLKSPVKLLIQHSEF